MIDRNRRDQLSELLRHFVDGLLTNRQFETRLDVILDDPRPTRQWEDKALWAIRTQTWFLYDDLRTHHMKGNWALNPEGRQAIARWILFLHSNCEYQWPITSFVSISALCLRILTLGIAPLIYRKIMKKKIMAMGDWSVWPFISQTDYEEALKRPRLLAGR